MMADMTSEKIVNMTVNNSNVGTGIGQIQEHLHTSNFVSMVSVPTNRSLNQPNPTAALLHAYLTLNGLTKSNNDNCSPNSTAVSHSSVATMMLNAVSVDSLASGGKDEFYIKVINSDKKKEFNTYVRTC